MSTACHSSSQAYPADFFLLPLDRIEVLVLLSTDASWASLLWNGMEGVSVTTQFDGAIITFRDGHFGESFKQNSVGIATDAVLH